MIFILKKRNLNNEFLTNFYNLLETKENNKLDLNTLQESIPITKVNTFYKKYKDFFFHIIKI